MKQYLLVPKIQKEEGKKKAIFFANPIDDGKNFEFKATVSCR